MTNSRKEIQAYPVRPLIDVIGLPSPELARHLVVLLDLAEPLTSLDTEPVDNS